jgi:hypothetical protein
MNIENPVERRKYYARLFEEWDRRYRAHPDDFLSEVEHLLGHTPASYGEACAVYFMNLQAEVA